MKYREAIGDLQKAIRKDKTYEIAEKAQDALEDLLKGACQIDYHPYVEIFGEDDSDKFKTERDKKNELDEKRKPMSKRVRCLKKHC